MAYASTSCREVAAYCGGQLFQQVACVRAAAACDAVAEVLVHVEVLQGSPELIHLQHRRCGFPSVPIYKSTALSMNALTQLTPCPRRRTNPIAEEEHM